MPNIVWEDEERREHDTQCEAKWVQRYREITKDICLATKGNKVWIRIMWTIVLFMLTATVGGNLYGISVASDQQAIDTQQSADVARNKEQIAVIIEAHKALVHNAEDTSNMVHSIREQQVEVQTNQKNIIQILGRIEAKVN